MRDADGSASMSQDFVTQLQLQLREAALREERRTPAAQRVVRARRGLPGPAPLAAALAVALLALAVAIGVLQLHDDSEPVKPKVIDTFKVSRQPGSRSRPAPAPCGRRDPDQQPGAAHRPGDAQGHRARPARAAEVQAVAGAGAVWALVRRPARPPAPRAPCELTRIDPRHEPGRRADPDALAGGRATSPRSA